MSYATPADVRVLLRMLQGNTYNDGEVQVFLNKANQVVDLELSRCYVTPIALPAPQLVRDIEAELAAAYLIDKHFSDRAPDRSNMAEAMERRARANLKSLTSSDTNIPGLVIQGARQFGIRTSTASPSPAQARWSQLENMR